MKFRPHVYNLYWQFAAERQNIFFKKIDGKPPPYSKDPIFNTYKFCNAYRASDRASQYLIKNVIYKHKSLSEKDVLFRVFLFRLFNKIDTYNLLESRLGVIKLRNFNRRKYSDLLNTIRSQGKPIYGSAYILCANKVFGFEKKHDNHLALLEKVFIKSKKFKTLLDSRSLKQLFFNLKSLPLIGDFMAYQLAIDFSYSEVFNFNENNFTVAGPGALRGINKCFINIKNIGSAYVINYMVDNQDREFKRLGIEFKDLWGRKLHAIDCQNLFCEVDKYTRVRYPKLKSSRVQIKFKYKPLNEEISYFYPPKWGINSKIPKNKKF